MFLTPALDGSHLHQAKQKPSQPGNQRSRPQHVAVATLYTALTRLRDPGILLPFFAGEFCSRDAQKQRKGQASLSKEEEDVLPRTELIQPWARPC